MGSRTSQGVLGAATALVVFFSYVCPAQVGPAFSIDHYSELIVMAPGETYAGEFVLTNLGEQPLTAQIRVVDFSLGPRGELLTLDPGTLGDRSLANFITYTPEQVTLAPGEAQPIRYSVTLPQGADGPHWASLLVVPETPLEVEAPVEPEEGEGIGLIVRYQVNYALTIVQFPKNSPEPRGQVVAIDARGSRQNGKKAVRVEATFQNSSDTVLRCQVYIECRDPAGETLFRYDFPPDRLVLPHSQRIFSHTFEDVDMPPGQYLILCVVDFGGEYLSAGQLIATVEASP